MALSKEVSSLLKKKLYTNFYLKKDIIIKSITF